MKYFKLLLAAPVLIFFLILFSGTTMSSCNKTTVHDTLTIVKTDTLIKIDTVIKVDSIYGLTCGLVAYYNFNGGNLNDSSGNNNNITFSNATPATDRFGRAGNAYSFDGSTSYMQVANSTSLNMNNSITLFAIVKANGFFGGPCHGNQILGKGYPGDVNGLYEMRFNDTLNACSIATPDVSNEFFAAEFGNNIPQGTDAGAWDNTTPVHTGIWYKLTYTYDGLTARFYVNGVLKYTHQKAVLFTSNTYDLFIGRYEDPLFPYWFNGVIDEIRIYNKPLSQGAITQLNNQTN